MSYSFNEICDKLNQYIDSGNTKSESEYERLFDEISQMITKENVNLLSDNYTSNDSLLRFIFYRNFVNQRKVNLAKFLVSRGADINHDCSTNHSLGYFSRIPLCWYIYDINYEKDIVDFELFKMLFNKNTVWDNDTWDTPNKHIINQIQYCEFIENKLDWFYEIHTQGNCPMSVFEKYLSNDNYNKFVKYIDEKSKEKPQETPNEQSQETPNEQSQETPSDYKTQKKNFRSMIEYNKVRLEHHQNMLENTQKKIANLEKELSDQREYEKIFKDTINSNEENISKYTIELEELEKKKKESLKEEIRSEMEEKIRSEMDVDTLMALLAKKISK